MLKKILIFYAYLFHMIAGVVGPLLSILILLLIFKNFRGTDSVASSMVISLAVIPALLITFSLLALIGSAFALLTLLSRPLDLVLIPSTLAIVLVITGKTYLSHAGSMTPIYLLNSAYMLTTISFSTYWLIKNKLVLSFIKKLILITILLSALLMFIFYLFFGMF